MAAENKTVEIIRELSETMREAIKAGNMEMAERIEKDIAKLIRFTTTIV